LPDPFFSSQKTVILLAASFLTNRELLPSTLIDNFSNTVAALG